MADPAIPDPSTWAGILNAMNNMDSRVQWLLFAAFIAWLVFWRGFAWYDNRQARKETDRKAAVEAKIRADEAKRAADKEEAEAARAREMSENIGRLCSVLEHHTSDEEGNATSLNRAILQLDATTLCMSREVRALRERLSQQMSRGDSLTAIEDKLNGSVRAEVCTIFDRSLRENNFAGRADYIRGKVKTDIGEILDEAKRKLETGYHLSVDLSPFFPMREGANGASRHVLCDMLWETIEPLYQQHGAINERIDEMRITVRNVVADLASRGREAALAAARRESVGV